MESYKREFIQFLERAGVLKFGDFTAKSGRKIPYFINAGMIKTGEEIATLGEFYARAYQEKLGSKPAVLYGPAYKGISIAVSAAVALSKNGLNVPFFFNRKEVKDHEDLSNESKLLFGSFYKDYIQPNYVSYSKLKNMAYTDSYYKFICGSDQVWNSTSMYVDPFYYLRFAPGYKKIAFAPSLGKSYIPDYNKKIIKKYISDFDFLSVREETGRELIESMVEKKCEVLIDPTLVLSKDKWISKLHLETKDNQNYILAYFLDKPSEIAEEMIKIIKEKYKADVVYLPYSSELAVHAGPKEFLDLVLNSKCILTDSFHGLAFSINFNKDFYAFSRNYGSAANQSSRLVSLLNIIKCSDRLDSKEILVSIDYDKVNALLDSERNKSLDFLQNSLAENFCHE